MIGGLGQTKGVPSPSQRGRRRIGLASQLTAVLCLYHALLQLVGQRSTFSKRLTKV